MSTGIIYLAKNKISLKSYVGQTSRNLKTRIEEHLKRTSKDTYKFARALNKYPENSWDWIVLAEVDIEDLDKTEAFFIEDLDTFKNGYNSLNGGDWFGNGNPRKNKNIYELWHPEHGIVIGTISELQQKDPVLSNHISDLVSGKRKYIDRYVLLKNKDDYDKIFKLYEFYHPNVGIVKLSAKELFEQYPDDFNNKMSIVWNLTCKKTYFTNGWILAESINDYDDLKDRCKQLTLKHPEYGVLTMKTSEWKKRFGLLDSAFTYLQNGRYKTSKGWSLVQDNE